MAKKIASTSEFQRTMTVMLGTGQKNGAEFSQLLKSSGRVVSQLADNLLCQPEFSNSISRIKMEVFVAFVATPQLTGKEHGGTNREVYQGAYRLGLEDCPAELAAQIRMEYCDQPLGEWINIGMKPIRNSDGGLEIFDIGGTGQGLILDSRRGDPEIFCHRDCIWAFRLLHAT